MKEFKSIVFHVGDTMLDTLIQWRRAIESSRHFGQVGSETGKLHRADGSSS